MNENDLEEQIRTLRYEVDAFLQGGTHLVCALMDVLEHSGAIRREVMLDAIRQKIEWLERHDVETGVATPLLLAEDWITRTPSDPENPFDAQDFRRYLRGLPRRGE